jgi:hypothetical protein
MNGKDTGKPADEGIDELSEESLEDVNGGAIDSFMFFPDPPPPPPKP